MCQIVVYRYKGTVTRNYVKGWRGPFNSRKRYSNIGPMTTASFSTFSESRGASLQSHAWLYGLQQYGTCDAIEAIRYPTSNTLAIVSVQTSDKSVFSALVAHLGWYIALGGSPVNRQWPQLVVPVTMTVSSVLRETSFPKGRRLLMRNREAVATNSTSSTNRSDCISNWVMLFWHLEEWNSPSQTRLFGRLYRLYSRLCLCSRTPV